MPMGTEVSVQRLSPKEGSSHSPPAFDKFGMGLGEEGRKEEQGL